MPGPNDREVYQRRCAMRGHEFPILGKWGKCRSCGLTVKPPPPDGPDDGERARAA